MSQGLAQVYFIGNVTKDPTIRDGSVKVAEFGIAVGSSYKDKAGQWQEKTGFHYITAFGRMADRVEKLIRKGLHVTCVCHIENDSYEKDGKRVTRDKYYLDKLFVPPKSQSNTQSDAQREANLKSWEEEEDADVPF